MKKKKTSTLAAPLDLFVQSVVDYAVFMLDVDGRVVTWNAGAERLKGWTRDEILGRHFSCFYPAEDVAAGKPARELEDAAAGGRLEDEGWRVRKDGTRFWANVIITALRDEGGSLIGYGEVTRDITERRRIEQMLASQKRLIDSIVENLPDAMVIADAQGRLVMVNAQAEALFGYRREELLGREIELLMPGRFRDAHVRHRDGYAAAPRVRPMGAGLELYGLRKGGAEFPIEVSLSPLETPEGRLSMSAIRDVTARKRAEESIRRLNLDLERRGAELTAANADLESFSFSVAHDLRAPLRQIAGFAQLLAEDYGARLDDQGRHRLEKVLMGAKSMGRLIDDLLNLARIGRQPLTMVRVPLGTVLEAAREGLAAESAGRDVEWRVGPLPDAACDPGLMKQVFMNLLSNALKYTRPRERALIEVGSSESGGERLVYVRDNGVGFDMRYTAKLFGVFQRLHNASEFEGTGVGLATVERIIRKHGGRIWAESAPGEGATFFFTLPKSPETR